MKHKFTIVELMIAIAIIMILISLLLPALEKARSLAREIGCKNNLKQIGILWNHYSDLFDGYLPLTYQMNTNWSHNLYVSGLLKTQMLNTGIGLAGREADKRNCKLLQCPGNPSVQTYAGMGGLKWSLGNWVSSEEWTGRSVKMFRITLPSERGMVVDHAGQGINEISDAGGLKKYYPHGRASAPCPNWVYDPNAGSYDPPEPTMDPPASAMINVAFCDGHVGSITYFQAEKTLGTDAKRLRFWSTQNSW